MDYAIDLSLRQSARTLEQAVRYQATALLEPATWPTEEGLKGRLIGCDAATVRVEITEPPIMALNDLPGTYCDATIELGHDRFLFSEQVVTTELQNQRWHLDLARPSRLQVCERRRFWRVRLAESSSVRLQWGEGSPPAAATGRLCNISGEGLACLAAAADVEGLLIGETALASFQLPGYEERFEIAAVLCNKTPTTDSDKLILGMQFLEPASAGTSGPAGRLNEFLLHRFGAGIAPVASDARVSGGAIL